MPTLEEILNQRIQRGIADINSPTDNPNLLGSHALSGRPESVSEKSMYDSVGGGLWGFGREFGENIVDSLLLGIPSAVTDWDPGEGADTEAEKWGRDIGQAAGFLGPFMAGKFVVSAAGRGLARLGGSSSTQVTKAISKGGRTLFEGGAGLGIKEGAQLATKKIVEGQGLTKSFMKDVIKPLIIKPIRGFDDYFGSATARNSFLNQTDDEAIRILKEYAIKKGYTISDEAAVGMNKIVKKALDEAGGRPVSNMAGLVSKYLGRATGQMDGKAASFYSHLFEEAMVFAAVENVIHGVDLWGGRVDEWDPMSTTGHAVVLGHILGGVRFIPGGIKGGVLRLMSGDLKKRLGTLIGTQGQGPLTRWWKGYSTRTEKGRDAIVAQYSLYAQVQDKILGGSRISKILEDRAEEYMLKKNIKLKSTGSFDFKSLTEALKNTKSEKEKKLIAKILQDGNYHIQNQARTIWRKQLIRAWASDLAGSAPRMFIGGVAMSGGPQVLFSEELTLQDKARALLIGAFLMKHGKELTYKGRDTKMYEMYEPFGRQPMSDLPKRLLDTENMIRTLGAKFEGKNSQLWSDLVMKVSTEQARENTLLEGNGEKTDIKQIESLLDIINFVHPKKPKKTKKGEDVSDVLTMFIADRKSDIKILKESTDPNLTEKKMKKFGQEWAEWREIYKEVSETLSADSIIGSDKRIKVWEELTIGEQAIFKAKMQKAGFKTGQRGITQIRDLWHDANMNIYSDAVQKIVQGLSKVNEILGIIDTPLATHKDGRWTFRKIDFKQIRNQLNAAQRDQIKEYNVMIEELNAIGLHKADVSDMILTKANLPNEAKIQQMTEHMVDLRTKVNEAFDIPVEQHFNFSDGWFRDGMRYHMIQRTIKETLRLLPEFAKSNPEWTAFFRVESGDIASPGNPLATKIQVGAQGKNIELNQRINDILSVLRKTDEGAFYTSMSESTAKMTVKEAERVLETLEENNILLFRDHTNSGFSNEKIIADVNRRLKWQMLDNGTVYNEKTGKWEPLNDSHVREIDLLEANGLLAKDSLTLPVFTREFWKIAKSFREFERFTNETNASRSIEGLIRWMENTNQDATTLQNIKNFVEQHLKDKTEVEQLNGLQNIVDSFERNLGKFVSQADGEGVLHQSAGTRLILTLPMMIKINSGLESVRTGLRPFVLDKFSEELFKDVQERKMGIEEAKTKKLLMSVVLARSGNRDGIDIVSLASEFGLYNYHGQKFIPKTESEFQSIRTNLKKRINQRWDDGDKTINDMYERLLQAENISPGEYNTTDINQIIQMNKYSDIFADSVMKTGKTRLEQFQSIYEGSFEYTFSDGTKRTLRPESDIDFIEAFHDNFVRNNRDRESVRDIDTQAYEAAQTLLAFLQSQKTTTEVKRFRFNAGRPSDTVHYADKIQKSEIIKILENVQLDGQKIVILDYEGMGISGVMANVGTESFLNSARKNLQRGTYASTDRKMEIFPSGRVENTKYIIYQYADNKYKYLIENNPANLRVISDNYVRLLQEKVNRKWITPDKMQDILEKTGFKWSESTSRWEKDWNNIDYKKVEIDMHRMMNDFTYGEIFQQRWWSRHRTNDEGMIRFVGDSTHEFFPSLRESSTRVGSVGNKIMKRARLYDNISAKNYTQESLLAYREALGSEIFRDLPNRDRVRQQMQDLAEGRVNQITIRDEGGLNTEFFQGKDGGISQLASVLAPQRESLQAMIDRLEGIGKVYQQRGAAKRTPEQDVILKQAKDALNEIDALISNGKLSDASEVNGVTFVDMNWKQTLGILAGEFNFSNIGGIKPIILGYREGTVFVDKTAFMSETKLQAFFDRHPGIAMVTFTSAAKDVGGGYEKPIMSYEEFNSILGSRSELVAERHLNPILPENIKMISTKMNKNEATLSLNHTVHLKTPTEINDFYNLYYSDHAKDMNRQAKKLKDVSSWEDAVAYFKLWTSQKLKEGDGIDTMYEQLGVQGLLAHNNVHPSILPMMWENMFKTQHVDPMLKKKITGGQGVLTPDINVTETGIQRGGTLINTLTLGDRIFNAGQIELPFARRAGEVDMDNTVLWKRNRDSHDDLIRLQDAQGTAIFGRKKFGNLGELHDWALANGYEVAVAVERAPVVKPSSVMLVALKGFRKPGDGPTVALNSADVKRAAEGDYDIDVANFYWKMPYSVANRYNTNRAEVRDSQKIGLDGSENYKSLDLSNPESVHEFNDTRRKADVMRGTVMNTQRIVSKIVGNKPGDRSQYKIATDVKIEKGIIKEVNAAENYDGFLMRLDENRYLTVKKDIIPTLQRIADLNQHILDAANGYNTSLFKDSSKLTQDIFFDKNHGLFQVRSMYSTKKWGVEQRFLIEEPGAKLSEKEMRAINDAFIVPYRDYLSLSNKIYDKGSANKVGFRDIVVGVEEFNTSMYGAEATMRKILKPKKDEYYKLLGDWATYARIGTGKQSDKFHENVDLYDQLMASVAHIRNINFYRNNHEFQPESVHHSKEINELLFEKIEGQTVIDNMEFGVKDFIKKSQIANSLERRIRGLKALRNKMDYSSSSRAIDRRIKLYESKKKWLLDSISKTEGNKTGMKDIVKDIVDRELEASNRKFYKKNKKPREEEQIEAERKNIENKIAKDGIPKIDTYISDDMIHAIAMVEGFGGFGYKNAAELGWERGSYKDMSAKARHIKKHFSKAWHSLRNNKEHVIDYMDGSQDRINWVNEDHIYQHFMHLIKRETDFMGTHQERNIFLAKIMTPTVDMTTLVEYRGKFFPKPQEKRIDKFVNLGLRYVYLHTPNIVQNAFVKGMGKSYDIAHLRLAGETVGGRKNVADVESDFYFDPFTFTESHSKAQFLFALNPKANEYSRLDKYDKFNKLFGTGMIRDHISQFRFLELPHDVLGRVGMYSKQSSLGTMDDLHRAFEMDNAIFLATKGQNSIFDHGQNLNNMLPYDSKIGKHTSPTDYVKKLNKQSNKWCD